MSSTASAPTERRGARTGTRTRRAERPPEGLERLRILLAGAMGAILVGYAMLVPVAALLLASGGSGSLDGSFAIAVPMWLAAHQIPVEVDGRALGVLPLTPTIVAVAVVGVAAGWSVRRLGGRIRHDAGPVVASQAGAAAVVAVLAGALLPGDVSVTTPWASMVGAGLLAGIAAGVGVLRVCGLPPRWTRALHGRPRAALLGARAAAAGLLLSGAVVVLLALVVRAGAVADSFTGLAPGAGAGAGVLLLAVGYLPNTLVAGVAWSLGPGFAVGAAQYGPFGTEPGPLPPFPLFAAVPAEPVPAWAAVLLLLPVGAGVAAGLVCRRALGADAPLQERAVVAAASAAVTAAGAGVVAAVAGGSLAGGPYDPVSLSPIGVLGTALVLVGVPATVAAIGTDELLGRPPSIARRPAGERARPPARPHGEGAARTARPEQDGNGQDGDQRDDDSRATGRDGAARNGTGRNGSERNGTGRNGTGRNGTGRNGTGRNDSGRKGSTRPGSGRDGSGRSGSGGSERNGSGRNDQGRDGASRKGSGRDDSGRAGPDRNGGTRDRNGGTGRDGERHDRGGRAGGRDGAERSGSGRTGSARDGSGGSERAGSAGRDRAAARDRGTGGDGARGETGREAAARDDRSKDGHGHRGRTTGSSRNRSSRDGRSRGASARSGSDRGGARSGPSDRTSRPRTVGDLVAQKAREQDAKNSEDATRDRPEADGAGESADR